MLVQGGQEIVAISINHNVGTGGIENLCYLSKPQCCVDDDGPANMSRGSPR